MKLVSRILIMGIAVFILFAFYYSRKNRIITNENQEFERSMETIQRLDATFDQDVLKVRFRMVENYDSFIKLNLETQAAMNRLKTIPRFIDRLARPLIVNKVNELANLLEKKGEILETFKSQNAVLKNSLRYFPIAGSELIKRLNSSPDSHDLAVLFNTLLRQILVYSLNPGGDSESSIRETLAGIERWQASHLNHSEYRMAHTLSAHAVSILSRQPKVEELIRNLVSVPTARCTQELDEIYDVQLIRALNSVEHFRNLMWLLCVLLLLGIIYVLRALRLKNIRLLARSQDLADKNEELHEEMARRMRAIAELERTREFIETSRLAGMAEVATNVLHNVGNVLNSVNIASACVAERIKKSKWTNLSKVAGMIDEHRTNLGNFFTEDSRGKQLPEYLIQLAEHMQKEQLIVVDELDGLQKNIDHIKDIVEMQQNLAKVSGATEAFSLANLMDDAVKLSTSKSEDREIELMRIYEDVPHITAEKSKVLQILVNLLRNAKQACNSVVDCKKQIILRVARQNNHIYISISDNGIGISAENLERIFSHGFTTKKDGHGFGLHSSALSAKAMGGLLGVHSDGPGQGAVFTLELPLHPVEVH